MNPTREDIRNLLKGIHSVVVDAAMTGSMQNSRPYLADSAKGKVSLTISLWFLQQQSQCLSDKG